MKRLRGYIIQLGILVAMFAAGAVHAQNATGGNAIEEKFAGFSKLLSPEKLYLQTDKEVYCVGDTVWFKGYLKNSSELSNFKESNYIYVEIISPMAIQLLNGNIENKEEKRARVKIKRMNNTFYGHIKIPERLNTGVAIVRAYSYWMLNNEPEYLFNKNIEIRNPLKDDFVRVLESRNDKNAYKYLQIGAENPFRKFAEPEYDIDMQFMPESGRYVVGENSVIAFKAINNKGMGVKIAGQLYIDGKESVSFNSNELGMGILNVNVASMPKRMSVKLSDNAGFVKTVNFPLPENRAVVMNLKLDEQMLEANVYSRNVPASNMWFVIYDGSEMYIKVPYSQEEKRFKVESRLLSEGINHAAVLDEKGNVYASRAFFVYPKREISSAVKTDKSSYKAKEKVSIGIDIKDENGKPLNGNFSLSVTDDKYAPYSGYGHNIISYMLLGSEAKGWIEKPQEYFNTEIPLAERMRRIDVLMLTQLWKYYDLPKIMSGRVLRPLYGKEYTQSISGYIYGILGKPKKSLISVVAPSINYSTMGTLDSTSHFELLNLDFPDGTEFIVSAANQKGTGGKRFTPMLDDEKFAPAYNYHKYITSYGYTNDYKKAAFSEFYNDEGGLVYQINPVYVIGHRTSKPKSYISPIPFNFKPGQFRGFEDLEPYKGFDVISYITMTCPQLRHGGGVTILCRTGYRDARRGYSNHWGPIKIYINGLLAKSSELQSLMVDDIDGFAYIPPGADAAKFDMQGSLFTTAIVMITTKMGTKQAMNVSGIKPLGWQMPKKMYEPKYGVSDAKVGYEPMRSTLHWKENINVVNGKAATTFYTSGSSSDYTVIVEGVTSDKQPVFIKSKIVRE